MPNSDLAPFTSVFRAGDAHRVKRNRQPVSCTACQKRKSKCDRQKPCGTCEKRGEGSLCRFGQASGGSAGKQEVQARLAKLEDMVKGLAASGSGSGSASIGLDNSRQDGLTEVRGTGDGADAKYHGTTSWAAVVDSIRDIRDVLEIDGEPASVEQQLPPQEPDVLLGDNSPITMKDVMESLPSRPDADKLVTTYFNARFVAVPFIHVHHFRRRYEAFWNNPEGTNLLWISLMFSILSSGAMIAKIRGISDASLTSVAEPRFYIRRAAQCLITGQYLEARPLSVEALTMFVHSRNIQRQDSEATIWALSSMAVRLGQRRGYHLDAARVSPKITPFEAEMRRRTWFMIQSADILFSFQHGLPPMVYDEVCDVDHPRNLTDDDFDEDKPVPPSRPPTDPIPILCWRTKSYLCRVLRPVLRHALSTSHPPYSETMTLQKELEIYYASVPACLRIRSIRETSFTDESYTIMHRLILELMYRKSLCVLHRRYLNVKKDDSKYNASREICRDTALTMLNMHLELNQETKPGGRMYEDRFMITSLTLHDFLVAAMVTCLDLSESTDISSSDRAHRIHILQQAHAVWVERSATSRDALHASKVLRAILNKVESPIGISTGGSTLVSETPTEMPVAASSSEDIVPPDLAPMQITEYHINFDEIPPVDSFFSSHEGLNWPSIDQYLRQGYSGESQWDGQFRDETY